MPFLGCGTCQAIGWPIEARYLQFRVTLFENDLRDPIFARPEVRHCVPINITMGLFGPSNKGCLRDQSG
jgi:hypothetical protein